MYYTEKKVDTKVKTETMEEEAPKTVYNYYINSSGEKKTKQKKKNIQSITQNDLDKFLESEVKLETNVNYSLEEEANEELEESFDLEEEFKPQIQRVYAKPKPIKPIMATLICLLMSFLVIYNLSQFSYFNVEYGKKTSSIEAKDLKLNGLVKNVEKMTNNELEEALKQEGYEKIGIDEAKELVPNEKNVPIYYNEETNWFDFICNALFDFLNK